MQNGCVGLFEVESAATNTGNARVYFIASTSYSLVLNRLVYDVVIAPACDQDLQIGIYSRSPSVHLIGLHVHISQLSLSPGGHDPACTRAVNQNM
jgi:hypothetical protein